MKLRVRWYDVDLSGQSIRHFGEEMLRLPYSRKRPTGFQVDEIRRDYVVGTFIERIEWDDKIEDPVGGELNVHRVELRRVNFRLSSSKPELQVVNAPRTLRTFTDALVDCASNPIAFAEPTVSVLEWLGEIERTTGRTTVIAITATGITLSASAAATVSVDGTGDVRKHLEQFTVSKKGNTERLVALLPPPYAGSCELTPGGRAVISDGNEASLELLRTGLGNRMKALL